MSKLFSETEVAGFEFVNISRSHSAEKLRGVKDKIELAKIKQLNHWDPVFEGRGVWLIGSDIYGDDFVLTLPNGKVIRVEYKLTIRTFHDQVHFRNIPVGEYCTLSNNQFKRYKNGEDNKHFLMERCIVNFDEETKVGKHNCLAYSFAKTPPEQQWDYLIFRSEDLRNWRPNKDYWLSATNEGEELVVFRKDIIEKRQNLTKHIREASEKGVLLSNDRDKIDSSESMDSIFWT
jgi:hypothetical protein